MLQKTSVLNKCWARLGGFMCVCSICTGRGLSITLSLCPMCQIHMWDQLSVCRDIRHDLTMDEYALLFLWAHTKTTVDSTYPKEYESESMSLLQVSMIF